MLQKNSSLTISQDLAATVSQTNDTIQETYRLAYENGQYLAISNIVISPTGEEPIVVNVYFRDGYQYVENLTQPQYSYRNKYEGDFPFRATLDGILQFPAHVIAAQKEEMTPEGVLLTFELDSEKYYAHCYPQTYREYGYGVFSFYRESPVYTVLIDELGRIKQITGHFCTVNADGAAYSEERNYSISVMQYDGVSLEFPLLQDADYPEFGSGR
ncbi:MAG: hypothetical protein GX572_02365 [Clostridia bacterium]|nr:hypothetical protein [Clostridia bacterium]